MTKWLIRKLLRGAVVLADLRLIAHAMKCDSRQCSHADVDDCDETSFCKVGNALFVDAFDINEVTARFET